MADFLLELRSEEIPARMQPRAASDLAERFRAACAGRGLAVDRLDAHVTPRRLALLAWGLPDATQATREERRGPRADAPEAAIVGFCRGAGVAREALVMRDDPKGRFLYAMIETPGRPAAEVLAEACAEAVEGLPWPKSMRWGAASASMDSPRWVRPLEGVVALLDGEIVPLTLLGVAAGRTTRGHRFMGPAGPIRIASPAPYAAQLREAFVVLDAAERAAIIRGGARAAAEAAGLALVEDEGLVAENAGLTEWPVPLLGRFDPAFLQVPREVIQLTMRTNQKYFACAYPPRNGEGDRPQAGGGAGGALAPAFVCVANIAAADGGATIIEGNRRVLAARLSDARFFFEQDLREWREAAARGPDGLWEHFAPKLERVVFHEKLGTMRDKAERVAKLARWLVESGAVKPAATTTNVTPDLIRGPASPTGVGEGSWVPGQARDDEVKSLADQAHRAARLAKCDLVSAAVGEFPELQGVMGGYYAALCGEDAAVAAAVRDHYRPVGPSDAVPTEPVSVAVALADKLDTFVSYFRIDEWPTGSRDPFALRRATLATISLLTGIRLRLSLAECINIVIGNHQKQRWLAAYDKVSLFKRLPLPRPERLYQMKSRREGGQIKNELFLDGVSVGYISDDERKELSDHLFIWGAVGPSFYERVMGFLADRLKVQQREAGVRHDLIDAVFALGNEDDLVRLLARVRALQSFMATEDGANLLAAYRRAANILAQEEKKDGRAYAIDLSRTPDKYIGETEKNLALLFHRAEASDATLLFDEVDELLAREDFEGAMAALARMRAPVDDFFEKLMVNDPDPDTRQRRLELLAGVRAAMHRVADFSKVEG